MKIQKVDELNLKQNVVSNVQKNYPRTPRTSMSIQCLAQTRPTIFERYVSFWYFHPKLILPFKC